MVTVNEKMSVGDKRKMYRETKKKMCAPGSSKKLDCEKSTIFEEHGVGKGLLRERML